MEELLVFLLHAFVRFQVVPYSAQENHRCRDNNECATLHFIDTSVQKQAYAKLWRVAVHSFVFQDV
jgi:hypothetical protein